MTDTIRPVQRRPWSYLEHSPKTMKLEGPIPNDLESKTGQPTAFTMGQRYVAAEKLAKAKVTSDLV